MVCGPKNWHKHIENKHRLCWLTLLKDKNFNIWMAGGWLHLSHNPPVLLYKGADRYFKYSTWTEPLSIDGCWEHNEVFSKTLRHSVHVEHLNTVEAWLYLRYFRQNKIYFIFSFSWHFLVFTVWCHFLFRTFANGHLQSVKQMQNPFVTF